MVFSFRSLIENFCHIPKIIFCQQFENIKKQFIWAYPSLKLRSIHVHTLKGLLASIILEYEFDALLFQTLFLLNVLIKTNANSLKTWFIFKAYEVVWRQIDKVKSILQFIDCKKKEATFIGISSGKKLAISPKLCKCVCHELDNLFSITIPSSVYYITSLARRSSIK